MRSSNGNTDVVAPSSAPMLAMVALPVALKVALPGPKYSRMALVATVQPCIEDLQQALRFIGVSLERALVLPFAAGEFVEEADLTEHRPDMAHLPHNPLDSLIAPRTIW